jgi:hypothetical protein
MENILANEVIQVSCISAGTWAALCSYWHWAFWLGVVVGVVGALIGFFMKPESSRER